MTSSLCYDTSYDIIRYHCRRRQLLAIIVVDTVIIFTSAASTNKVCCQWHHSWSLWLLLWLLSYSDILRITVIVVVDFSLSVSASFSGDHDHHGISLPTSSVILDIISVLLTSYRYTHLRHIRHCCCRRRYFQSIHFTSIFDIQWNIHTNCSDISWENTLCCYTNTFIYQNNIMY